VRHNLYSRTERECISTILKLHLVDAESQPYHPQAWFWMLPKELLWLLFQFVVVSPDFSYRMSADWKHS
jgi:hypothetical protein